MLTSPHTHDDAHGLVPTRLTVDIGYVTAYISIFEAHNEHGPSLMCLMCWCFNLLANATSYDLNVTLNTLKHHHCHMLWSKHLIGFKLSSFVYMLMLMVTW